MAEPDSILWLTEETPDARTGGGGLRQEGLLVELGRRIPVDLVVAGDAPSDAVAAAVRRVVSVPAREAPTRARRARTAARALVGGDGLPEVAGAAGVRRSMAAAIEADQSLRHPAATVAVHLGLAPLLDSLPGATVFHPFHVASAQLQFEAAQASGVRAARLRRYADNALRLERWAVRTARLTVAVCDDDAKLLAQDAVGSTPAVVPNAVDLQRYEHIGPLAPGPVVLLPASLGYEPNIDGAVWMASEVWPRVRQARPDARLLLVGKGPVPAVVALGGRDGVEVHGDVADMTPFLQAARVVVVPLRYGTGTRLKVLEALAARRPVVGTGVGVAGLGVADGIHARVADEPEAFADAVVQLLDSADTELIDAGRTLVEERYTWPAVVDRLLDALRHASNAARECRA